MGCPAFQGAGRVVDTGDLTLYVQEEKGEYEITYKPFGWVFKGKVESPIEKTAATNVSSGELLLEGIEFHLQGGKREKILLGKDKVFFTETWTKKKNPPYRPFPDFHEFPGGLFRFSFKNSVFSPPLFGLSECGTPWLFFDGNSRGFILSPSSAFMVARMKGDGKSRIMSGILDSIREIPGGFSHGTVLVFGKGINGLWEKWGKTLTSMHGKKRPGPYSDITLKYLGYWTDNGGYYYYNFQPDLGYEGTLLDLFAHFRKKHIPYKYLQLDSWWYPKTFTPPDGSPPRSKNPKNRNLPAGRWNRYGGMYLYEADPGVFSRGLKAFHEKLGLPLVTHNRWIDRTSPYRKKYRIPGVGAIDPRWWDDTISRLSKAGVKVYEQDWLNVIYYYSPGMRETVDEAELFMDGMARACKKYGLTIQYCMPLPRHHLQASKYGVVTTVRVSGDRFNKRYWRSALFTSRLASALGIYPWVDVFRSWERDNMLLSVLSAGIVGPGDPKGKEDVENIFRAARRDGVLVKPDFPLVPADETWISEAGKEKEPFVCVTSSVFRDVKVSYIFAWNSRKKDLYARIPPPSVGYKGKVYIYDYFQGKGETAAAEKGARKLVPGGFKTRYFVVSPVLGPGIAVIGDLGKFATCGKKRIKDIKRTKGGVRVEILFAGGEKTVTLGGYAESRPGLRSEHARLKLLSWDPASGFFKVSVDGKGRGRVSVDMETR